MTDRQRTLVLPFREDAGFVAARPDGFFPNSVFALWRLAGCYHFNNRGNCTALQLAYSLIVNLLLVAGYVYLTAKRVKLQIEITQTEELIDSSIAIVIHVGNIIFSLASSVVLYLHKNRFPQVMKNVKDLKFHTKNKIIGILLVIIFIAMVFPPTGPILSEIPYYLVVFQHFLYISQYVALTNRWNRYLMTMIKFVSRFDEKMMEGHAKIIRANRSLNEIYGWPILFNVVLSFTITVQNLFKFYSSLKQGSLDPTSIPPVLFYSLIIFWVADVSDRTTKLAEKFNMELFNVMNVNTDMRNNTTLRLYLMKKYSVEFTACGFFDVGYPIITSLIAAAVTYLVVLIQFTE